MKQSASSRCSSIFRFRFSGSAFSGPTFSTPDIWCCIFRSFIFSGPLFSVDPSRQASAHTIYIETSTCFRVCA